MAEAQAPPLKTKPRRMAKYQAPPILSSRRETDDGASSFSSSSFSTTTILGHIQIRHNRDAMDMMATLFPPHDIPAHGCAIKKNLLHYNVTGSPFMQI
eukprot:10833042-Ditylum_brightwellii.AAC.1